jgi:hypothetical protein
MESVWQPTDYAKVRIHSTCVVSHTRASAYTEVDVRRDRNMYTFLRILLLLSDVCFFSMYFLHRYSNARDKTLLGGIWIILRAETALSV